MTDVDSELRRGLRELADRPTPVITADQALARAGRLRLRRAVAAGGALVLVVTAALTIALPEAVRGPGSLFGAEPATSCGTTTDGADPARGVPSNDWPEFVAVAMFLLPSRDDYTLQSSTGECAGGSGLVNGYAVINLGPNREHGHLTLNLTVDPAFVPTCATVPTTSGQLLFCEESTADMPMLVGVAGSQEYLTVTAAYPDGRMVWIEAIGTPLDAAALRLAVSDPALAGLLHQ